MAVSRLLGTLIAIGSAGVLAYGIVSGDFDGTLPMAVITATSILWLVRTRLIVKRAGSLKADRVWVASAGWTASTFELDGLEADGEALQELTAVAEAHGYRREAGDERYAWRFTRGANTRAAANVGAR